MEERKKISFGFNLGDDKIKLIDIQSEDDDFLVASPFCDSLRDSFSDYGGFRLSSFGNSQDVKIIQQQEQNVQPSDPFGQHRPSYLRRSLAWDNAFFNSAGVLDPDELSLINEGFRANEAHLLYRTQDVRKRRSESDSTTNGDGDSLDWFEIEPLELRRKSFYNSGTVVNMADGTPKLGQEQQLQNVQDLEKVHKSFLNKMKSNQTSRGKSIDFQNEDKKRNETTSGRKQRKISSPKPLKALGRMKNISTRSNNRNISAKLDVKMEYGSATTDSGQESASQNSPTAAITSTVSAPFINASIGASSPQAASLTKRKTESRKSKLSSSLSASKIWRHSETRKGTISCPTYASPTSHWYSESLSSSGSNKQRSNGLKNSLDVKKTLKGPFLHSYGKEASHSQTVLQSPLGSSQAVAAFKQSGLRPPSPRIRFFSESTLHRNHEVTRSRKLPQKVLSGGTSFSATTHFNCLNGRLLPYSSSRYDTACKKLNSPCLEVAVNIKRTKTDHANTFLEEDKEMCLEMERVSDRENDSGDQLGNLRKYLEAIDLNQEKRQINRQSKRNKKDIENQLLDSPMASSKRHQLSLKPLMSDPSICSMRTPLTDKASACNLSETLASQ